MLEWQPSAVQCYTQGSLAAALVADLHADWSSGGLQAPQKAKCQEDFQVNLLRLAKLQ